MDAIPIIFDIWCWNFPIDFTPITATRKDSFDQNKN